MDETVGPARTTHANPVTPKETRIRAGIVRTGAAQFRSDAEIRDWLSRWREAGATVVHGTFAGYRDAHDWWNNRSGDYDFLMRIQRVAIEMGLTISQSMFLMKNTIPSLGKLVEDLDRLPAKPVDRFVLPIGYTGRGRSSADENQRITEEDREALLNSGIDITFDRNHSSHLKLELKSERERITGLAGTELETPISLLGLHVHDGNIDFVESTPCQVMVDDLRIRVEAAYQAIPSRTELMLRYGDPDGKKIYGIDHDLEALWLDRCLRERDIPFERCLTHLH